MHAEASAVIDRRPDEVFAYLVDPRNLTAWQSGVTAAAVVGGGPLARGARIEESRHMLGRELHTTLEVVELEEPSLFVLRALDAPIAFTVRHELEAAAAGTRLVVAIEADTGPLPGFATGLMARRVEKQFRGDVERLKRLLES